MNHLKLCGHMAAAALSLDQNHLGFVEPHAWCQRADGVIMCTQMDISRRSVECMLARVLDTVSLFIELHCESITFTQV